ncbi:MAG TPA: hypothetical protein PLL30_13810 [Candidatus Krumholzibacteria bacterium]|nr:hypothetical protein [Candidatus Krumholzibacteria bacterium]HRY42077.1 hypothetical protein [Candidatus Krumholzibacteria bacterium]
MFRNEALELGRFKRDPNRWQTEFGRWVADFGVPRIVAGLSHDPALRITNQTVYEWLQGHAPQPVRAMALVEMSQGRLTLEAIYQHGRQMRQTGSAGGPQ